MSSNLVTLIKGDTLIVNGVYEDVSGTPVNLTSAGIAISSNYMTPNGQGGGDITATPNPDQVANPGQFTLTSDTSTWAGFGEFSIKVSYTSTRGTFSQRFPIAIDQ